MIEGSLGYLAFLLQLANPHRAAGIAQRLQDLLLQIVSGRNTEKNRVKPSPQGLPASKLQGRERSTETAQSREGTVPRVKQTVVRTPLRGKGVSVRWTLAPQLDVWLAKW